MIGTNARWGLAGLVAAGSVLLAAGAAQANYGLPEGQTPVTLDPADFTTVIDNPYYPLRPGDRRVYRETAPDGTRQKIVDRVTDRTKRIANGVTARVVIATVTDEAGKVVEFTEEWFAQDRAGNVWYFGEDTVKSENGRTDTTGSFEAGVNGAQAGVQMPARPRAGMRFRLEGGFATGAADQTVILSAGREQVEVPFGHFRGVVMNRDSSPSTRSWPSCGSTPRASVGCSPSTSPTATTGRSSSVSGAAVRAGGPARGRHPPAPDDRPDLPQVVPLPRRPVEVRPARRPPTTSSKGDSAPSCRRWSEPADRIGPSSGVPRPDRRDAIASSYALRTLPPPL